MRIEDDSSVIWLENGIVFFIYKNVIIDLETQKTNILNREIVSEGIPRPLFTDARKIRYWTREARKFGSTPEATRLIKAMAIVYNSHVHSILLNWAIKFFAPPVPIHAVSNKEEGVRWLQKYL